MLSSLFLFYALSLMYSPVPTQFSIGQEQAVYPPFSTILEAGISLGDPDEFHIYAEGSVQTWESAQNFDVFNPAISYYRVRAGIATKNIDLSISHLCIHPTIAPGRTMPYVFGGDTTVSLTFRGKSKLF